MKTFVIQLDNAIFRSESGALSAIDNLSENAFPIERFYYVMGTKAGVVRGNHAHKKSKQILTCVSGKFNIYLDDGEEKTEVVLEELGPSLVITTPTWLRYEPVIDNSILLVLSDSRHDRSDYITDYNEFLQLKEL